jgi:hypothetical protein
VVLFACSGIAMEHTAMTDQEATIIVTSKRLVTEFNDMRNRDDDLRVGATNHCVPYFLFFKVIVIIPCADVPLFHYRLRCSFLTKTINI